MEKAIISLNAWRERVGVTACTVWRWRKKGWLKTVNICGRLYLTQDGINEFYERAQLASFPRPIKPPSAVTIKI